MIYLKIYLVLHIICIPIVYYIWRYEAKKDNEWTWLEFKISIIMSILIGPLLLFILLYEFIINIFKKIKMYLINKLPKEPPKWL